jgi:hypothetical protein
MAELPHPTLCYAARVKLLNGLFENDLTRLQAAVPETAAMDSLNLLFGSFLPLWTPHRWTKRRASTQCSELISNI